jgi:Glycosyl transferase family 2
MSDAPAERSPSQFLLEDVPEISVVLGSYNRRKLLEAAIDSVRRAVGNRSYEIAVCDGGSTDGSREWLAAQPDVLLVADRRLTGAVVAFNHAYRLTRGKLVANFNDDAAYQPGALDAAATYLKSHPEAAQVCLKFTEGPNGWGTNEIHGKGSDTRYANYALTRRDVLDQVVYIQGGFWSTAYRTYAGDCEQSAWIHRLGWKVDELDGPGVIDHLHKDGLREGNTSSSSYEARLMYHRWPLASFRKDGLKPRVTDEENKRFEEVVSGRMRRHSPLRLTPKAVMAQAIGRPQPHEEDRLIRQGRALRALDIREGKFPARAEKLSRERVLHVSMCTDEDPQAALVRGLTKLGSDGYSEVRWFADHYPYGKYAVRNAVLKATAALRPTLVFMQLQTTDALDASAIHQMRQLAPGCTVVSWCGDIADVNSPWTAGEPYADLGRICDLVLHSSMSHVHVLRSYGVHVASYLQIGYDERQYCPESSAEKRYDVCFLGNAYGIDRFSESLKWNDVDLRSKAILSLSYKFGPRFGLFGYGWRNDSSYCPLSRAHEIYQNSKIGLNVSLSNSFEAYTSDRLFRILGCGSLLLTKRFPMMSVLGLVDGENCVVWDRSEQVAPKAEAALCGRFGEGKDAAPFDLAAVAQAGHRLAVENHTWDVRMLELCALVDAVRRAV